MNNFTKKPPRSDNQNPVIYCCTILCFADWADFPRFISLKVSNLNLISYFRFSILSEHTRLMVSRTICISPFKKSKKIETMIAKSPIVEIKQIKKTLLTHDLFLQINSEKTYDYYNSYTMRLYSIKYGPMQRITRTRPMHLYRICNF